MAGKFLGVIIGAALLVLSGAASAGQSVTLADAQLDTVAAGTASVSAFVNSAAGSGNWFLTDEPNVSSRAAITFTFVCCSSTGDRSANVVAVVSWPTH